MLKVSIFTPSHNTKYLNELYNSIKDQNFYEWIILLNNKADWKTPAPDIRVKIHKIDSTGQNYVGTLKRLACSKCNGDILLEVDHDDLLINDAVNKVRNVFHENPDVGFVYSNCCNFKDNFQQTNKYDAKYGWKYRDFIYKNHILNECISFPPTPESVSRIWFAPNHLRAWRKDIYWSLGGHDDMRVLDDQDLLCRTYLKTKMHHINECLYLYRVDGNNTWIKYNKEIQDNVLRLYDKYIESLILKLDGRKIDLGGGLQNDKNYESVDLKNAKIICDLNSVWPFEDNSISVIRACDIFEHLKSPVFTMKEAYRVLKPGGWLIGQVPSTDGRGAFQDPTHVSFWNENSFLYYTNLKWSKYIDTPVRFQSIRTYTTELDLLKVCWVKFQLIKLTDDYRPPGLIEI